MGRTSPVLQGGVHWCRAVTEGQKRARAFGMRGGTPRSLSISAQLTTAPLLIVGTKTRAGLIVKARLDRKIYKRRIKVLAQEMKVLALEPHLFHGE